ncbi:MAG TPA: hypothetical protein VMZ53_32005 [Kofleriaceae bacterium]|nr:hypothetical protein [Kofleriaceae bacterium]
MKRAFAVVVVLGSACSGGSNGPDAPVDDNLTRPDATDDQDHDTILDKDDNCPSVVNLNQGNEDGDKFGDACDPCPIVADDDPPDTDGDKVADACDPLPTMPGDFIRYFEGFHTAVPAGWEEIGVWTHTTGAVRTTSAAAGLAIIATDRTRETISAALTFDAVTGTSRAGVVDTKMAGGPGVACVIAADPSVEVYATNNAGNATQTSYEQTTNTKYVVKLRRNMNEYTCTASAGATASAMKTLTLTPTPYLSGITAADSTVRFHWFMVVESL